MGKSSQVQEEHMKLFAIRIVALAAIGAFAATASYAQDAAAIYKSKCQACHGADGAGDTTMGKKLGARDFHSPEVAKMTDTELFDITKKGKAKMPGYEGKLTDSQIKDLVKYIRTLK
jgi:mono/diheme cytochrome c family protein